MAMQLLGPGEEKVTLHGTIYPYYYGGFGQLERMCSEVARGVAIGSGCFSLVPRLVNDVQNYFLPTGEARKFDIEMVAYGPDRARL